MGGWWEVEKTGGRRKNVPRVEGVWDTVNQTEYGWLRIFKLVD